MNHIPLCLATILLALTCSCTKVSVTLVPGAKPPSSQEIIAIAYPDACAQQTSDEAREIIEQAVKTCRKKIIGALEYEAELQKKGLSTPRRVTPEFIKNLKSIIYAQYLLTFDIGQWVTGSGETTSTKTKFVINLWSIDTGASVLRIEIEGSSLELKPIQNFLKKTFAEWEGFCQ